MGPRPPEPQGPSAQLLRASVSHAGTRAVARHRQKEGRSARRRQAPGSPGPHLWGWGTVFILPGASALGLRGARAIPRGGARVGLVLQGGQGLQPSPFPIPEHPQGKHSCKPSPQHSGAPRPLSTEPLALPRLSGAEVTGNDCAGQSPQGCKRASWTAGLAPLRAPLPRGSHTYHDSRTPGPPAGPAFSAATTGQEAKG